MRRVARAARRLWVRLWSRENALALGLCLLAILLIIATSDDAPAWIYQGF